MKSGRLFDLSNSPSYPSPLDRIRTGKQERAAQFGLSDECEESFECNQSFPRAMQPTSKLKPNTFSPDINRMKGYELNSVSFLKKNLIKNFNNSIHHKSNYLFNDTIYEKNPTNNHNETTHCLINSTFDKSWAFYNQFLNTNALVNSNELNDNQSDIIAITNPNKALIVINGRTTEILTANNISCDLFGYNESKLIGMRLKDLLDLSDKDSSSEKNQEILMELDRLDENGHVVLCSGKIFDAITIDPLNYNDAPVGNHQTDKQQAYNKDNYLIIPISMYMLKLTDEQEPKCLCVMEPVQRVVGNFAINLKGRIRYYNPNFSYIFGYTNSQQTNTTTNTCPSTLSSISTAAILNGKDISELIPSMKLPLSGITPEIKKQLLTGRSYQDENIPLTVTIINKQLYNNEEIVYNCTVSVYTNISGLVTVRSNDYQINSYNSTFARLLFGYDEKELLNKPITYLIPNFFEPDTQSTMATANKMTPLTVNNSYLNPPGFSTSKHYSLSTNTSQINNKNVNGSFLESKQMPIIGNAATTPSKQTSNQNLKVPSVLFADVIKMEEDVRKDENEPVERNCPNCHYKIKRKALNEEILTDFNLKDINGEYSPNKKCVNYLESNTFSPKPASSTNTPQSSVKKSLLAKAIKNNANTNANMSIEESMTTSPSSSNSSSTSLSSLIALSQSPTTKDASFSNLEVSEFEENLTEQEDDIFYENTNLCEKCQLLEKSKKNKKTTELSDNEDATEVSLIAIDNEDNNDDEEMEDIDQYSNKATHCGNTNKRKVDDKPTNMLIDKVANNDLLLNDKNKKFKNQVTSTPAAMNIISQTGMGNSGSKLKINTTNSKLSKSCTPSPTGFNLNDGIYFGRGRHNDGSLIKLIYQRRMIKITGKDAEKEIEANKNENKYLFCVWISRDPYSDKSIMEHSLDQSQIFKSKLNQTLNGGEFSNYLNEYEDLRTLGRGASGFVQLARRKLDKFEVVTKYILKSKIYKENWINDERYGNIPLEISILCKLDHPNLIKVLEVFQDTDHVQMIMEKHGCGMDLFEFIDRQRKHIEEALASHIFRQIVSAVSYLHANSIVHRDIKDENIVINEQFHIKLIDFGSAAYVVKGKRFATFCGTIDYCSPDVLLGNKYYGPELDVWTCGIALYTLVFSENPFFDAEETIECILKPPFKVSKELMKLLFSILCPKPELRATIQEIETSSWVTQEVEMNKYKWEDVVKNIEFHSNNAGDCFIDEEYNTNINIKPVNKLNVNGKHDENDENKCNEQLNVNGNKKLNTQMAISALMSKSF